MSNIVNGGDKLPFFLEAGAWFTAVGESEIYITRGQRRSRQKIHAVEQQVGPFLADAQILVEATELTTLVIYPAEAWVPTSQAVTRPDLAASGGAGLAGGIGSALGATTRIVQDKLRDFVSGLDYGFTDAQRAVVRARSIALDVGAAVTIGLAAGASLGAEVWYPAGTYLLNTAPSSASWAGCRIRGTGLNNTIFRRTAAGDMITLTGASRGLISDVAFDGTGMSSGGGVVLSGAASGVMEVRNCQFANFPGRGLYANFTNVAESSSNEFANNLFLSNGVVDGTPQAEFRYCNDSKWIGNQFGADGFGGPYPTIGCYLYYCRAGDYESNYHWENLVGGKYEACDYTRFDCNRWETNQREGCIFIDTSRCTFTGNHVHTNSMQATGTYDGTVMENCGRWSMAGNSWYTFASDEMRYCLSMDSACNIITVTANLFFDFATAPVNWDRTSFDINFSNNLPTGYGLSQTLAGGEHGKAIGIAGGVIAFAGPAGASFVEAEVATVAVRKQQAITTRVNLSAAPSASKTLTVTLRKNGADTSHVVTLTAGQFTAQGTFVVSYAAGDTFSWKVDNEAGSATTTVIITTAFDA